MCLNGTCQSKFKRRYFDTLFKSYKCWSNCHLLMSRGLLGSQNGAEKIISGRSQVFAFHDLASAMNGDTCRKWKWRQSSAHLRQVGLILALARGITQTGLSISQADIDSSLWASIDWKENSHRRYNFSVHYSNAWRCHSKFVRLRMLINAEWHDWQVVTLVDPSSEDIRLGHERTADLMRTAPHVKCRLGWKSFG